MPGTHGRRMALTATVSTVLLVFVGVSCGGGGDEPDLSEAGARGKGVSSSNGCASCHGSSGQGGVGPAWQDLAGSMVELDDGTLVLADDSYLERAIVAPEAEIRAGYRVRMPTNGLDDQQVRDVIAYIHDLSPESGGPAEGSTGE